MTPEVMQKLAKRIATDLADVLEQDADQIRERRDAAGAATAATLSNLSSRVRQIDWDTYFADWYIKGLDQGDFD